MRPRNIFRLTSSMRSNLAMVSADRMADDGLDEVIVELSAMSNRQGEGAK